MKILVSFKPNKKYPDFEGVRLRKTIKGALEMVGIEHTSNELDKYDVMHLISVDDENKINEAKEKNIPVVISACYCEDDPSASYLEYKSKDGKRTTDISNKTLKFLNKADLVLVPSESVRSYLIDNGVTSNISIALPGINMSRFDFSREDEKTIFFRYFREDSSRKLVIGLGEYDNQMDGINAMINAAKICPEALFYYIGKETIPGIYNSLKIKKMINAAPRNMKFVTIVPDDIYRSALLNAEVFVLPGYKTAGVISVLDAMASKCQIIARKQAIYDGFLEDGKDAYLGEYSETITSLIKDYLSDRLKPTIDDAYIKASKCNLKATGEQLQYFYLEQINLKKI